MTKEELLVRLREMAESWENDCKNIERERDSTKEATSHCFYRGRILENGTCVAELQALITEAEKG